jgi:hypothetical protein
MKKIIVVAITLLSFSQETKAQFIIGDIIKAGIKKVIQAVDLKIQRLQNKTIWLQNAQKTLENELSKLKLQEIGDWANKQKELYGKYFDELSKVKTVILTYQSVKDIVSQQESLVKEYSKAFNLSKQDRNFTTAEINYMGKVYSGILGESLKNIESLQMVITSFATQMSDAKRLEIIHNAAGKVEENLSDLRQFNQQNVRVSLQRSKEKNDIDVVRKLYGLQ